MTIVCVLLSLPNADQKRGMSRQDAEDVIGKIAKYEELFINFMMNEELGLQVCYHTFVQ